MGRLVNYIYCFLVRDIKSRVADQIAWREKCRDSTITEKEIIFCKRHTTYFKTQFWFHLSLVLCTK